VVGITDTYTGADTQAGKGPNECTYYSDDNGDPYALHLTRMDANGGWVSRPISLVTFLAGVDKIASPIPDILSVADINVMRTPSTAQGAGEYAKGWLVSGNWWMHNGCMSGTLGNMIHFANDISIAITINTRPPNDECNWGGLYPLADAIQGAGITWPSYNLF